MIPFTTKSILIFCEVFFFFFFLIHVKSEKLFNLLEDLANWET